MATHLITGGAGYLGHQLACALHERGHRVRVLDILDPADLPQGVEIIRGDVLDTRLMRDATEGIDVVHHNAALVPVTKAGRRFWRVHVEGTESALDSARRAGVRFFIYVSTSAVFGIPERVPITDETPLRPFEDYGLSKLEGEKRVLAAARVGLNCSIIRPRTIVGPGRLGIFKILYEWISEGRKIYVIGDGDHPHQFIHASDIVDFILRLSERRKPGTYNVGAERFGTLREDLGSLIRHAGTSSRVVGTPAGIAILALRTLDWLGLSPLGPWHYRTYDKAFYFDISRPMRELDWLPRFSNVEAFTQSYDWYLQHRTENSDGIKRSTHRKSVKEGILRILKHIS